MSYNHRDKFTYELSPCYSRILSSPEGEPLSRERELELARAMKAGDLSARDKLVNANLRFVFFKAKKFMGYVAPFRILFKDLFQEGASALTESLKGYDPYCKKPCRIITWAKMPLMRALYRCLNKDMTVRVPRRKNRAGIQILSLDAPINSDSECTHLDLLCDPDQPDSFSQVARREEASRLNLLLRDYPDKRAKKIIIDHYGLYGRDRRTLEEIGREFKITRERVRQIEEKAFIKLGEKLKKGPDVYLST